MAFLMALGFGLAALLACSNDEDKPSGPPVYYQGRVSIQNQSGVAIRLLEFSQIRGDRQSQMRLGIKLYPDHSYVLHNILDPGTSDIFPGGDQISVRFIADIYDPQNPNQPLFENTVQLTVNGTVVVHIKTGGEYGISPD